MFMFRCWGIGVGLVVFVESLSVVLVSKIVLGGVVVLFLSVVSKALVVVCDSWSCSIVNDEG